MATDRTESKIPMYVLTQEQINQIAAVAGEEAVKRFRAEQVKSRTFRTLPGTFPLLFLCGRCSINPPASASLHP